MSRTWFWIVAYDGEQPIIMGEYGTPEEAINAGVRSGCPYEKFEWPTRDKARATQIYKHERMQRGDGLHDALTRVRHTIPDAQTT